MVCIYCGNETRVTNSRLQKRNNQVWRRRQCMVCGAIFTTHEAVDLTQSLLVNSKGSLKPFLPDKLFTDILATLAHRKDRYASAREITSTVIQKLLRNAQNASFSASSIAQETAKVLKRFDNRAYLRYVADHESLQ